MLLLNLPVVCNLLLYSPETCDTDAVLATIRSFIPQADLISKIGSEVTVSLPFTNEQTNQFFKCLRHIDREAASLGVDNYGIYDTTLEEVRQIRFNL